MPALPVRLPMGPRRLLLLKNAGANLVRGGASLVSGVLLPLFLVRALSPDRYSAWALVMQFSAYALFLDFGVQTVLARFVAQATARGEAARRGEAVSAAFALLTGSALLAYLLIALLAWQLPRLLHALPPGTVAEARLALLIVGGATALSLPASVVQGLFVGLQRNEVSAAIIAGSRLCGAGAVLTATHFGGGLVALAAGLAGVGVVSCGAQFWVWRGLAGEIRFAPRLPSGAVVCAMLRDCSGLCVWSAGELLVGGLDLVFVAFVDFPAVASYSVAVALVLALQGLNNALFAVLIPEAAILGARGEAGRLGGMLVSATRYGVVSLMLTGLPLILGAVPILSHWLGASAGPHAASVLRLLVAANILRLTATPYAALLIGTGQQRLVWRTPLLEGGINVAASLAFGLVWGAAGIALGTLLGAAVGLVSHFFYDLPRTRAIAAPRRRLLRDGVLRPLAWTLPLTLLLPSKTLPGWVGLGLLALLCAGFLVAGVVAERGKKCLGPGLSG